MPHFLKLTPPPQCNTPPQVRYALKLKLPCISPFTRNGVVDPPISSQMESCLLARRLTSSPFFGSGGRGSTISLSGCEELGSLKSKLFSQDGTHWFEYLSFSLYRSSVLFLRLCFPPLPEKFFFQRFATYGFPKPGAGFLGRLCSGVFLTTGPF